MSMPDLHTLSVACLWALAVTPSIGVGLYFVAAIREAGRWDARARIAAEKHDG